MNNEDTQTNAAPSAEDIAAAKLAEKTAKAAASKEAKDAKNAASVALKEKTKAAKAAAKAAELAAAPVYVKRVPKTAEEKRLAINAATALRRSTPEGKAYAAAAAAKSYAKKRAALQAAKDLAALEAAAAAGETADAPAGEAAPE